MTDLSLGEVSGRFQLLPLPMELPGNCVVCKAVDRPVLDFGVEIDSGNLDYWSGRLYMCVECIFAAVKLVDRSETGQSYLPQLLEIKGRIDEFLTSVNHNLRIFSSSVDGIFGGTNLPAPTDDEVAGDSAEISVESDESSTNGQPDPAVGSDSDSFSKGPVSVSSGYGNGSDPAILFRDLTT